MVSLICFCVVFCIGNNISIPCCYHMTDCDCGYFVGLPANPPCGCAKTSWMHANGPFHYLATDLPIYRPRGRRTRSRTTYVSVMLKCSINRRIHFPFFSTPSNRIKESGDWWLANRKPFFLLRRHIHIHTYVQHNGSTAEVSVDRRNECKR